MKILAIKRFIILWIVVCVQAFADAPYEQFYAKIEELHPQILKNAIGVFSLSVPVIDDYTRKAHGTIKKYSDQITDQSFKNLQTFQKTDQGFVKGPAIPVNDLKPVSGWVFVFTRVMRFPIFAQKSNFLAICIDTSTINTVQAPVHHPHQKRLCPP